MARRYIGELTPGERIEDQVFLIASKDLRQTNQGSLYIHLVLVDRTGQVPARIWQATEAMFETIPEGGFLRVKGRSESYKGSLQFIVEAIRPIEDRDSIELGEFMPKTEGDIEDMWARVEEIVGRIRNEYVAALMHCFLADEELVRRFKTAPAAAQLHHAYLGGLLEHTLAVLEMAVLVVPRYPKVSLDLVLAGVFLHDIAKTAELKYETNFGYADAGQLVGHIPLATVWIELKAAAAAKELGKPFPNDIKYVLQHIVLSHHGQYEFGSPKLPALPEAVAVHYLDNLDAKLHTFVREIEKDPDDESRWTKYKPMVQSKIFKPDVLNDRTE
ncbi:MAG TPA: HD domain-containing protein [Phycisphaerae bacterium]|nr:HD domain-containing protein [Phycisphaerae bacterium]